MASIENTPPPKAMERKYWVQFRMQQGAGPEARVGVGEMEVTRELPICGMNDVIDIAQAIANGLVRDGKVPVGANINITVIGWIPFEKPSIIVATTAH